MSKENNEIDMRRLWRRIKKFWWLYAICLAAMLLLAFIYKSYSIPKYNSYATMMIEDKSQEGAAMAAVAKSSAAARMLSLSSAAADNEIVLLNSNDVMTKTVARAGLNVTCIGTNDMKRSVLYPSAPLAVDIPQSVLDTMRFGYNIRARLHDGKVDLRAVKGPKGIFTIAEVNNVTLPYTFKIPGRAPLRIVKGQSYSPALNEEITLIVSGTQSVIEDMHKKLSTEIVDKTTDAISLNVETTSPKQGEAILRELMNVYNETRLERRRETARNELDYCNDRLSKLLSQLNESEAKVENFKRANNMTALALDSAGWIAGVIGSRPEIEQSQNQLTYYDQVLYTLRNDPHGNTFLPSTLDGAQADPLATEYNRLVSEKRDLQRSATDEHPTMKSLNEQISKMRNTIITNFSQNVELSRRNLGSLYNLTGEAKSKVRNIPGLERQLFDLMRDKAIKNELYLYLLQRRTAAELKYYSTDEIGFVIEQPYSDTKPSMTKIMVVFIMTIMLSLILPTLLLWFVMRRRDALIHPEDMSFTGLEENTVEAAGSDNALRRLRALIASHADVRKIYVSDMTRSHNFARTLADSMNNADVASAVIDANGVLPEGNGNDALLTIAVTRECDEALKTHRYAIITVPSPSELEEIIPLTDAADALLLIVTEAGRTRRKGLRRLLRGQQSDHVLIYIDRAVDPAKGKA